MLKVSYSFLASDLNRAKGEDLTEEEKCINFMDEHNKRVDNISDTIDVTREMLSSFDISSSVSDAVGASLDAETIISAACVVLSAASNVASVKFPDMTMHKVLASLERIEGNLKTILEAPLKKAINTFEFILKAVKNGSFESAFDKLERLIDNAETAFLYAEKNELSVKSYRECSKGIRLFMFGHLLKESYDKRRKVFLTPEQLEVSQVSLIGETLENIARKCIVQRENVKTTNWGFESDFKKSEAQDILDSILKFAYPYISSAKKLTNTNQHLKIQDLTSSDRQIRVLPDLLPMGYEDGTQLTLGYITKSDGRKSVVKVNLWRGTDSVWCEYEKCKSSVKIESDTGEVVIELPCPGPFTLSVTGRAGMQWPDYAGEFSITEEEHSGRSIFRHSDGKTMLFGLEDGGWGVSRELGFHKPAMFSNTPATNPARCQDWQYWYHDDGWKYYSSNGNITVTYNNP